MSCPATTDRPWSTPGADRSAARPKATAVSSSWRGRRTRRTVSSSSRRRRSTCGRSCRTYVLILAAVALLCWLLALTIVRPIRQLAGAVDRFGTGDLTIRIPAPRRDEVGDLARAFNRMAERIETLMTAERRLLQDISHELRSPLTRLHLAVELARTATDRDQPLVRIQKEVDRLTTLVETLIEMTRAEGDPATRKSQPVELAALVQEVVQSCSLEAQARHCQYRDERRLPRYGLRRPGTAAARDSKMSCGTRFATRRKTATSRCASMIAMS